MNTTHESFGESVLAYDYTNDHIINTVVVEPHLQEHQQNNPFRSRVTVTLPRYPTRYPLHGILCTVFSRELDITATAITRLTRQASCQAPRHGLSGRADVSVFRTGCVRALPYCSRPDLPRLEAASGMIVMVIFSCKQGFLL